MQKCHKSNITVFILVFYLDLIFFLLHTATRLQQRTYIELYTVLSFSQWLLLCKPVNADAVDVDADWALVTLKVTKNSLKDIGIQSYLTQITTFPVVICKCIWMAKDNCAKKRRINAWQEINRIITNQMYVYTILFIMDCWKLKNMFENK